MIERLFLTMPAEVGESVSIHNEGFGSQAVSLVVEKGVLRIGPFATIAAVDELQARISKALEILKDIDGEPTEIRADVAIRILSGETE